MHYTISLPEPHHHLVDVVLDIPNVVGPTIQVQMAAWTPGSYLIREYARLVRDVRASSAQGPLLCRKLDKLTWEITTTGATEVRVEYQVYGYDLTVRTNHIDSTHAHLTPAATLMFVPGREHDASTVTIHAPEDWRIATSLAPTDEPNTFSAPNLDVLMDAPYEIGIHQRFDFTVDDKPHALVIWGHGNEDTVRLVADAKHIVETQRDFWGSLPYESYTFILLLGGPGAGGGLEHQNSTVLLLPRHIFGTKKDYERYISLVSHEFFHTWNVKRLRAAVLGPFNYTSENYTRLLWVMEGFTEYYTDLLLVRAGLMSPERYLARLSDDIVTLQTSPGRLRHSVADASLDAWIKLYRPDETTPNTTISYYLKGAMVALILDMEMRRRSEGATSLDDLMHYLYETYPFEGPGIPEDDGMRRAIETLVSSDFGEFFARYVDGVAELPFDEALATVGVQLKWGYKNTIEDSEEPQPTLGARVKTTDGRFVLTHVIDGGSAFQAGLAPNDEVVAFDQWRVDEKNYQARLADYAFGDTVNVTVFRSETLLTVPMTLVRPEPDKLTLKPLEKPSEQQQQAYRSWFGLPAEEPESE